MMGRVQIARTAGRGTTAVSNVFIDEYMADANDAQLKVYLYLLRKLSSGRPTTVMDIADKFNHTEKDIHRALIYWEKKGILRLEYDTDGSLQEIALEDVTARKARPVHSEVSSSLCSEAPSGVAASALSELSESSSLFSSLSSGEESSSQAALPQKRSYSAAELNQFIQDPSLSEVFGLAEMYFKRPVSSSEQRSVLYIYDSLHFSTDLMDYLFQYTVKNAKSRSSYASYLEKVAIEWNKAQIRTPEAAKTEGLKNDKRVLELMRALGMSNLLTPAEAPFFDRWLNSYAVSMDILLEACRRSVLRTQGKRLNYAEKILFRWHEHKVTTMEDIRLLDEAHEKELSKKRLTHPTPSSNVVDTRNRFNRYEQHNYDFEELKQKIVSNK